MHRRSDKKAPQNRETEVFAQYDDWRTRGCIIPLHSDGQMTCNSRISERGFDPWPWLPVGIAFIQSQLNPLWQHMMNLIVLASYNVG